MRWLLLGLLLFARLAGAAAASDAAAGTFDVLCYHEVRKDVRDYPDPYAVDESALVAQFDWLRGNGYTPVSLEQVVASRAGGNPLPPKAVLLTFDDAYLSFYTRVFPLLKAFGYPAVLAVVGRWIDEPPPAGGQFGEKGTVPVASFPGWGELREMAGSGLVEIASHSYDLHRGVPANPQGNVEPAATTRLFAAGAYEDDAAWNARVRADLQRNSERIAREIGRRPRAIVWPYGSYNGELVRIAASLGMPVAMTLEDGPNTSAVPLATMRRILVAHNPTLAEFAAAVRGPLEAQPLRAVRVRLDDVYDADPVVQDHKLSQLLERMRTLAPSHVYLQPFAGTGEGAPLAAYFPTRHLPMRADLFNRVAWQLATRAEVKVHALLPAGALRLAQLGGIVSDLARHASIRGLVFMPEPGGADAASFIAASRAAADEASRWRLPMTVTRGIAAQDAPQAPGAIASPDTRIANLAAVSDFVLLPATPADVAAAKSVAALNAAVSGPKQGPWDTGKLVVMLESDPSDATGERVARQMRALQLGGQLNFGYGDDAFDRDLPPLRAVAPVLSLRVHPR